MKTTSEMRRDNTRALADKFSSRAKFADFLDKTPAQINHIIGKNPFRKIGDSLAREIEEKCGMPSGWLDRDNSEGSDTTPNGHAPQSNAHSLGQADVYESDEPLGFDEIEVPYFADVELAAGNGYTNVLEHASQQLRFNVSTFNHAGVNGAHVACCRVNGDSMEPVLPDGAIVAVDTSATQIRDGKMYAINHAGLLRVKYLYRLPYSGLRIRSANPDHPDEDLSAEMAMDVKVIGKVFWFSAFTL